MIQNVYALITRYTLKEQIFYALFPIIFLNILAYGLLPEVTAYKLDGTVATSYELNTSILSVVLIAIPLFGLIFAYVLNISLFRSKRDLKFSLLWVSTTIIFQSFITVLILLGLLRTYL